MSDELKYLDNKNDDDLFNELQKTRIDIFAAEHDTNGINENRVRKLLAREDFICEILEKRGLHSHKIF
jgi:membrane-bound lytic murein transglycosylase MltF